MSKYIIKKVSIKKAKINYPQIKGYEFTPKSEKYSQIKKVTVLDEDLTAQIMEQKIAKEYKKIVTFIYDLLKEDDSEGTNCLKAYTELQRLKQLLIYKYNEKVKRQLLEKYLKKLSILEMEIQKLAISFYQNHELTETENKGVRR